jgi:hypothetical protein
MNFCKPSKFYTRTFTLEFQWIMAENQGVLVFWACPFRLLRRSSSPHGQAVRSLLWFCPGWQNHKELHYHPSRGHCLVVFMFSINCEGDKLRYRYV